MRYNNVTIKGTGSYLPEKILTNEEIEKSVDTTSEWIYNKLGILERRIANENETPSVIGHIAAIRALENAKIDKEDLDMIIVVTSSPEQISPPTACIIHNKLNIKKNVPAFDINAVCSGFVYALSIAAPLISSKTYKNILIVATEVYSKITNWKNKHCVFFGDGAAAVVLGQSNNGYVITNIEANGNGTGMTGFSLSLKEPFVMNGKEVWDQAIKVLPNSIKTVLSESGYEINDIKMLIPHQASINILKNVAEQVGLPTNKIKTVMHKYGNIAGASIPIAMHEAITNKEVSYKDKIILTAVGSGWAWGSIFINYDE